MARICDKCNREFSARSNLSRHLRQVHGEPSKHLHSLICPICEEPLTREKFYLDHLRLIHNYMIDERELSFGSEEDFYNWKTAMEKATSSFYRKDRSKSSPKQKTMYFTCNRSGSYSPKKDRKRRLRAQGSRKINRTCPAKLVANKNNETGHLSVYFIPTHIGHEANLRHLNLHKEDRMKIARNLEQGVDRNHLLTRIKDSLGATGSRLNLLTVKDLRNIKDRCLKSSEDGRLLGENRDAPSDGKSDTIIECITSLPGTDNEFEVEIDGEIDMIAEGSIFFDPSTDSSPEDRQKLVENIMESINEIPLETLNSIKELIEDAKQKKMVVDMGTPIQSKHSRRSMPSSHCDKSSDNVPNESPILSTRLRKILPKPCPELLTVQSPKILTINGSEDLVQLKALSSGLDELTVEEEIGQSSTISFSDSKSSETVYIIIQAFDKN
ncbi:uncharacterized protein LOC141855068 [Brevipalpus obovatus]|uniref:uncharacterized protein LOC141855068 n=1 Tax=Brevipalpus obovatus TaxID=246614 RepID=UPI003D9F759E